ncbi:uncharacterized protein V1510DRAFT_366099 [Dipodascopsis tothii]|uniref:uncharacterized protein n=1 Tax=Dipodascopsis tothii TaxID=44089 RepID=UPI0034CE6F14
MRAPVAVPAAAAVQIDEPELADRLGRLGLAPAAEDAAEVELEDPAAVAVHTIGPAVAAATRATSREALAPILAAAYARARGLEADADAQLVAPDAATLAVLRPAVGGSVAALRKVRTILNVQRVLAVRRAQLADSAATLLQPATVVVLVRALVAHWRWRSDQPFDELYLAVVHSALALCHLLNIAPYPDKAQRVAIYSRLAELEPRYRLQDKSTVFVRELVMATRPRAAPTLVQRLLDRAGTLTQARVVAEVAGAVAGAIAPDWIERLLLIEECARTPELPLVAHVLDTCTQLFDETVRAQTPPTFRVRDITTDVVDGTRLSARGAREAYMLGLLDVLRASVSEAYPAPMQVRVLKFSAQLLKRMQFARVAEDIQKKLYVLPDPSVVAPWPPPQAGPGLRRKPSTSLGMDPAAFPGARVAQELAALITCPLAHEPAPDMVTVSCGHTFSRAWIDGWLASTGRCPVCRRQNVSIVGPAMWTESVRDLIRAIDTNTPAPPAPPPAVVVGVYLSAAAVVVGAMFDRAEGIVLLRNWNAAASFAAPPVVYENAAGQVVGWGGNVRAAYSKQAPARTRHVCARPFSAMHMTFFLRKLRDKVAAFLQAEMPDVGASVRYVFGVSDVLCPAGADGVANVPDCFLRQCLAAAGWDLAAVELAPETKCAAVFAIDENSGGVRSPHDVLHMVSWDYFGVSQRAYRLCFEDRFSVADEGGAGDAAIDGLLADELVARVDEVLAAAVGEPYTRRRADVLARVRASVAAKCVADGDFFECIPASRAVLHRVNRLETVPLDTADQDPSLQDLLHIAFHAKKHTIVLGLDDSARLPDVDVREHGSRQMHYIAEQDLLLVPSFEVARCMNVAATKALASVPAALNGGARTTLAVFGSCPDNISLLSQLPGWINSDAFARARPHALLTMRGVDAAADERLLRPDAPARSRSPAQVALDGLWLMCGMVLAGEA